MHPELDLVQSIRPGLDILANEIVIALKKRTRFPRNEPIYVPGLVVDQPEIALLAYELQRVEQLHAELGRYAFASQEAFTDVSAVEPIIKRSVPGSPIQTMPSGMGSEVEAFYTGWIREHCATGKDESTYGETVTADVNAMLAILERINLGKFVAESKMSQAPEQFAATAGDREAILALIVKKDREGEVIKLAERLADNYDLPAAAVVQVFEWMVQATIEIEIAYVRLRLAEQGPGPN